MKAEFEALIKEIKNKSLVSGDKSTYVTFEFNSTNKTETLNNLNELHKADRLVKVAVEKHEETLIGSI